MQCGSQLELHKPAPGPTYAPKYAHVVAAIELRAILSDPHPEGDPEDLEGGRQSEWLTS